MLFSIFELDIHIFFIILVYKDLCLTNFVRQSIVFKKNPLLEKEEIEKEKEKEEKLRKKQSMEEENKKIIEHKKQENAENKEKTDYNPEVQKAKYSLYYVDILTFILGLFILGYIIAFIYAL